jgi:acyl dehydratase
MLRDMNDELNLAGSPALHVDAGKLIAVGEVFTRQLRYTREDIARVARETGDHNPLHHDVQAAQRARHGEIIASGQQTASQMMGMVATHFSRADDGLAREMLCLNFNFAFKAPVFADQDLHLSWRVDSLSYASKLGGWVGELSGLAWVVAGVPCLVGRGTVLVKQVDPA